MREDGLSTKNKKSLLEGRAVMTCIVAVTAFLCFFTAFEIFVIKMEWNIPVMSAFIGGSENYIFSHYREEEERMEQSRENEPASEYVPESTERPSVGNVQSAENDEATEQTEVAESESAVVSDGTDEEIVATEMPEKTELEEFPYYIKINRQQNVITVYEMDENGEYAEPVRAILCSTGLYNATPKGVFHLSNKYIWRELNGGVYGQYASRITGGVLFHSVPYASKNKSTLYWDKYNKLGQQASMGCVRLTVEDAKWIYDNCPSGTAVEVYDSEDPGPLGKPEAMKLDKDNANKGWDPTDPDENNPWHAWSGDE